MRSLASARRTTPLIGSLDAAAVVDVSNPRPRLVRDTAMNGQKSKSSTAYAGLSSRAGMSDDCVPSCQSTSIKCDKRISMLMWLNEKFSGRGGPLDDRKALSICVARPTRARTQSQGHAQVAHQGSAISSRKNPEARALSQAPHLQLSG